MARYIDADRLLGSIKNSANECRNWKAEAIDDEIKARADAGLVAFIECALRVERQPTADVEEVRHGEWIEQYDSVGDQIVRRKWLCSVCGECQTYGITKRCPECGAKMDGKNGKD